MKFINWTRQEIAMLIALTNEGKSISEISSYISDLATKNTKGFPTSRSIRAVESKRDKLALASSDSADSSSIDSKWLSIQATQRAYQTKSKFSSIGLTTGTRKILSLSDIHFPFARLDFLNKAIADHADADILVLNGDIIDGYASSSFDKEKKVAAADEYNCAFDFVVMCAKKFPKVVLIEGNHDIRTTKSLGRGVNEQVQTLFNPDSLARIANGERLDREGNLVEKLELNNVYYPATEKWWIQIGQTLFIHPHSRGSSKPAFTVSGWAKKFQDRLPAGSFDSVVCGHTHQCAKTLQSNLLLIEQGCLCDYMSYSWQPRDLYHSSAMNGYAVIYQDEQGNTDFNKSNFVYLGQLLPIDKPIYGGTNGYQDKSVLLKR